MDALAMANQILTQHVRASAVALNNQSQKTAQPAFYEGTTKEQAQEMAYHQALLQQLDKGANHYE